MLQEHMAKAAETTPLPPAADDDSDTAAIISAYMKVLGAKGGRVSGARRMEMPEKQRQAIAKKAAAARWASRDKAR